LCKDCYGRFGVRQTCQLFSKQLLIWVVCKLWGSFVWWAVEQRL
jgi:hypothetical protein